MTKTQLSINAAAIIADITLDANLTEDQQVELMVRVINLAQEYASPGPPDIRFSYTSLNI
jgi:hypothetical protein